MRVVTGCGHQQARDIPIFHHEHPDWAGAIGIVVQSLKTPCEQMPSFAYPHPSVLSQTP
jgi:hypothetical protein